MYLNVLLTLLSINFPIKSISENNNNNDSQVTLTALQSRLFISVCRKLINKTRGNIIPTMKCKIKFLKEFLSGFILVYFIFLQNLIWHYAIPTLAQALCNGIAWFAYALHYLSCSNLFK